MFCFFFVYFFFQQHVFVFTFFHYCICVCVCVIWFYCKRIGITVVRNLHQHTHSLLCQRLWACVRVFVKRSFLIVIFFTFRFDFLYNYCTWHNRGVPARGSRSTARGAARLVVLQRVLVWLLSIVGVCNCKFCIWVCVCVCFFLLLLGINGK